MRRYRVGILGATGLVGQSFILLLNNHPWFEVKALMASPSSKGKRYAEAVGERWKQDRDIPDSVRDLKLLGTDQIHQLKEEVDLVFSAVNMEKSSLIQLEEKIAGEGIPVVSNNSATRWLPDVPMVIPEINPSHTNLIEAQRERLKTKTGFIVVKPNCSLQSYVPALTPLLGFGISQVFVTTYQAVSGAGRHLPDWPEMQDNVIPFISGEEEKSENEPLKIWGQVTENEVQLAQKPKISAQCIRVPVEVGHLAAVFVRFDRKVSEKVILDAWQNFTSQVDELELPSAPRPFLNYFDETDRPQPKLDALGDWGMRVSIGRLRKDPIFDYKFVCLSNNLVRGAAGGSVLTAELLVRQGWIQAGG
ncbi:MAG: aspartate-semialdehyde dehydrogenase [Clostridiaceae bacterium]|jgi:aspartate-semialdehyde dehydrogenase|nr:aspartate-semialdehyde dehydrogenase [Clostridiaceae bacterium]